MTNLEIVIEKIEKARLSIDPHLIVKIVAVSKYTDSNSIRSLYKEGQRAFGENRVQDLELKTKECEELPVEWHFLGNLQRNKTNRLIELSPTLIHSIDSLETALYIDKRLKDKNKFFDALLQINSADEQTKSGVTTQEAKDVFLQIKQSCKNLNLCGVMSIGAHSDDEKIIQKSFEDTKKVYDTLNSHGAKILSMGMSSDYELAIKCGSNMVRVGSVLFK